MTTQVLNFLPDGTVQMTRTPDPLLEGHIKMERVSDIKFSEHFQKHYIVWLMEPFKDKRHDFFMAEDYLGGEAIEDIEFDEDGLLLFNTYEDAVAHEVTMLNAMREAGIIFE